jgi:hypothetical protein
MRSILVTIPLLLVASVSQAETILTTFYGTMGMIAPEHPTPKEVKFAPISDAAAVTWSVNESDVGILRRSNVADLNDYRRGLMESFADGTEPDSLTQFLIDGPEGFHSLIGIPRSKVFASGDYPQSEYLVPRAFSVDSNYTPPNGVDLQGSGFEWTAMEFTLDSYTHIPSPDGFEPSRYSVSFHMDLFAVVPEPATGLLALVAVCLGLVQLRMKSGLDA